MSKFVAGSYRTPLISREMAEKITRQAEKNGCSSEVVPDKEIRRLLQMDPLEPLNQTMLRLFGLKGDVLASVALRPSSGQLS